MPQRGNGHRRAQRAQILQCLRNGNTRRASALSVGVAWKTLWEWTRDDDAFRSQVEKAEAEAELAHVANIVKAGTEGTWTASAWWLERKQYQDWGRKDTLALKLAKMTEEELDDYIAAGERAFAEAGEGAAPLPSDDFRALIGTEIPALPE